MTQYFLSSFVLLFATTVLAQMNTAQLPNTSVVTSATLTVSRETINASMPSVESFRGTEQTADIYSLKVNSSWDEMNHFEVGSQFISKTVDDGSQSYKVAGLGNVNLNYWRTAESEEYILSYGIMNSISLAKADTHNVVSKEGVPKTQFKNNYSGYHTFAPFVGSDFYVGKVAMNVRGSLLYLYSRYQPQNFIDGNTGNEEALKYRGDAITANRYGVGLDFFTDVPVNEKISAGMAAGLTRSDTVPGRINVTDEHTAYRSSVYGKYSYNKETTILGSLGSDSRKDFYDYNSTQISIGVQTSL